MSTATATATVADMVTLQGAQLQRFLKHYKAAVELRDTLELFGVPVTLAAHFGDECGVVQLNCTCRVDQLLKLLAQLYVPATAFDVHRDAHRALAIYEVRVDGFPIALAVRELFLDAQP